MKNRLEELVEHLRAFHSAPEQTLVALRVPPACHELGAVAQASEQALTRLCDHHDAATLLDARDVVRGILRLLPLHGDLSSNNYRSLDAVPDLLDDAYRALPQNCPIEPWWHETLREALLVHLLLAPDPITVGLLVKALRRGLPISLALQQRQNSPIVRIQLLRDCLTAEGTKYSREALALADTAALLEMLPALRFEKLHPDNVAALATLRSARALAAPTASPRERLSRLARDIGVAAIAQRREYHAPAEQRIPSVEIRHELIRRSERWSELEQVALQAILLLGRLGTHILQTNNQDSHCYIERHQHEAWIHRHLSEAPEFTRQLEGPGYAHVGRQIHIPLPRRLGHALAALGISKEGALALRSVDKKLRDLSRDSGQPISIRRLTRAFEHDLENETPDEALVTLLGLQAQARRDAGIHYFAPDATALIERVRNVIERVVATFDLEVLDEGWSTPPPAPAPYLGYSYRADIGSVRALIAKLQSSAELGRGLTSPQRVIHAYNARVARLTLMYLAGTGGRPTGSVLPCHADVSLDDRAAIASEKDALGYRSTRLVPLTARFVAEVAEFDRWASAKHLLPRNAPADAPLAKLRTADGSYVTPTITALKLSIPDFAEHWVWPDDMFRHLFRSRLWEMGCPSSWLRRAMGHHPPHGATDMPWCARPQWDGLHDWTDKIDEHLDTLGF
jgi:hypothetical protein